MRLPGYLKPMSESIFPLPDVAAQLLTYQEGPFLANVLSFLVNKVARIIVLEDKNPMFKTSLRSPWSTEAVVNNFIARHPYAADIIDFRILDSGRGKGAHQETDRRNAAFKIAEEEHGCKWSWIIDADEMYAEDQADALWRWFLTQPDTSGAICSWFTYWRSIHYRVEPAEPFRPFIIARSDSRAKHARELDISDCCVEVPEEICRLRHYSWVKKPEEVRLKISCWTHADQVKDSWFDSVFMKWSPDVAIKNLHPTHPECYRSIMRCDLKLPEAMHGHPFTGIDLLEDTKSFVLFGLMPDNPLLPDDLLKTSIWNGLIVFEPEQLKKLTPRSGIRFDCIDSGNDKMELASLFGRNGIDAPDLLGVNLDEYPTAIEAGCKGRSGAAQRIVACSQNDTILNRAAETLHKKGYQVQTQTQHLEATLSMKLTAIARSLLNR